MNYGVFSDKNLEELIETKIIFSAEDKIKEGQIQPSSLDLRLGSEGFCLPCSSLPIKGNLREYFKSKAHHSLDLSKPVFLHKGKIYVVKLQEELNLFDYFAARANPKSSTGRTDIHVRLVTKNGEYFDNVHKGYKGELWLEIISRSFDLRLSRGISLAQMRVFDEGIKPLDNNELECMNREEGLMYNQKTNGKQRKFDCCFKDSSVLMGVNLEGKVIGYVARSDAPEVNLDKKDNPASKFFNKVDVADHELIIDENLFYILSSLETSNIPLNVCAEMSDISTESGEYRAHYAGFFDPGFNAPAVFEIRNFGSPFMLRHGQKVTGLKFYRLKENSERPYGGITGAHYQGQKGPKLAKFFDIDK